MEIPISKLLQQINSSCSPYDYICPERFINVHIMNNLRNEVKCLGGERKRDHEYTPHCKERLEILSAVLASFSYNLDARSKLNNTNVSPNNRAKQSIDAVKKHDENVEQICDKPCDNWVQQDSRTLDSIVCWHRQVCDELADDNVLLQLICLQESCQCTFASLIIKKIICSCAAQYNTTATILHHILEKWKRTKISGADLDLVDSMMSTKPNGDDKSLREQVLNWLLESESLSLLSTWLHNSSWTSEDEFQDNMVWLSILGKLLKHCVSSVHDIPTHLGSIVVGILEKPVDMFFSFPKSNHIMGQFMFLKFLKIVNKFITVRFCYGKVIPCDITLKCCENFLQLIPSMLELCDDKGYMKKIAFWGYKNNRVTVQQSVQSSQFANTVMAGEMFLSAVKCAAVLISTSRSFKDELVLIQRIWACFQTLMERHFENDHQLSGWIPILLGDQDDKWIEALLCLLLIYKEHNHTHTPLQKEHSTKVNHKFDQSTSSSSKASTPSDYVNPTEIFLFWDFICPHKLFLQFVDFIYFDPIVVSDFLVSPETNFLDYFTKYLCYLEKNWNSFVSLCSKPNNLVKNAKVDAEDLNRKDDTPVEGVNSSNSGKRKCSDDVKNAHSSKFVKQSISGGPLVSYVETDSDSSEVCSDIISPSPSLPDNEHRCLDNENNKQTELTNVSHCNGNVFNGSIDSDASGTGSVCDEVLMVLNDDKHESVTNNSSRSPRLASPSWSSSSCSLSDEQDNIFVGQRETAMSGLHIENTLDSVMTMLIRLRFHIERLNNHQLFPYDVNILIGLLSSCEEKYENM